jgi:hypothetical protein
MQRSPFLGNAHPPWCRIERPFLQGAWAYPIFRRDRMEADGVPGTSRSSQQRRGLTRARRMFSRTPIVFSSFRSMESGEHRRTSTSSMAFEVGIDLPFISVEWPHERALCRSGVMQKVNEPTDSWSRQAPFRIRLSIDRIARESQSPW